MKLLSATDVAIAAALRSTTLKVVERSGRFGAYWAIEDAHGIIEVALSPAEADQRVSSIREALQ